MKKKIPFFIVFLMIGCVASQPQLTPPTDLSAPNSSFADSSSVREEFDPQTLMDDDVVLQTPAPRRGNAPTGKYHPNLRGKLKAFAFKSQPCAIATEPKPCANKFSAMLRSWHIFISTKISNSTKFK